MPCVDSQKVFFAQENIFYEIHVELSDTNSDFPVNCQRTLNQKFLLLSQHSPRQPRDLGFIPGPPQCVLVFLLVFDSK